MWWILPFELVHYRYLHGKWCKYVNICTDLYKNKVIHRWKKTEIFILSSSLYYNAIMYKSFRHPVHSVLFKGCPYFYVSDISCIIEWLSCEYTFNRSSTFPNVRTNHFQMCCSFSVVRNKNVIPSSLLFTCRLELWDTNWQCEVCLE